MQPEKSSSSYNSKGGDYGYDLKGLLGKDSGYDTNAISNGGFNEGKDGWLGLSQTAPADHAANAMKGFGTLH